MNINILNFVYSDCKIDYAHDNRAGMAFDPLQRGLRTGTLWVHTVTNISNESVHSTYEVRSTKNSTFWEVETFAFQQHGKVVGHYAHNIIYLS